MPAKGKPATRPSPRSGAASAPGKPAARKTTRKPEAFKPSLPETQVEHISPEEAVAHIQALLEAKQERVKQGPGWPGAEKDHPSSGGLDPHAASPADTGGLSSEAGYSHSLAHERGEQNKRKG